jgi:hypothetical protein
MKKSSSSRWVLVSEVPLDEKNGAGMWAVLPYLKALPGTQIASLYLSGQSHAGQDLKEVEYVEAYYRNQPGLRILSIFTGTLSQLVRHFKKTDHYLVLPNSIRDVVMGLTCCLFTRNTTVWVMDDFIESYACKGKAVHWICSKLFQSLYLMAAKRIVVSYSMDRAYHKKFGKPADGVLGRSLLTLISQQKTRSQKKLRLVYVGSFINHYSEPILLLKRLLSQPTSPLDQIDLKIDLFGMNAPPDDWLLPGKIEYRGAVPSNPPEHLLRILSTYDFGLIPYSFSSDTKRMMSLSFPSKLIDYLGASLPAFIIAPPDLAFLQDAEKREIGILLTTLTPEKLIECLYQMASVEQNVYHQWQANAYSWAQQEFQFDSEKLSKLVT